MDVTLPIILSFLCLFTNADSFAVCASTPSFTTKCTVVTNCRRTFDDLRALHSKNPRISGELLRITCGFERNIPKICCPQNTYLQPFSINQNSKGPLADVCGSISFNRILTPSGSPTELEQYEWLALLEYRTPTGLRRVGCGGALISERYVLTAAHCVGPQMQPIGVRLGEYNLRTREDCVYEGEMHYCSNKTLTLSVEEVTPHEQYVYEVPGQINLPSDRLHDIALVRLNRPVPASSGKPICLPAGGQPRKSYTTAGWGVGPVGKPLSEVKRFAQLKSLDGDACAEKMDKRVRRDLVCTSASSNYLACLGDSGGPLMAFDEQARFTVVGVSAVANDDTCSKSSESVGLYTDVNQYVDWIYDRIHE